MTSVTPPIAVPDAEQRKQAIDPSRSFIVEAPAGSGKTSLLVQRFLRLLSLADRPESVVAMTFTRKAAAEMRERVLAAMEAAHSGPPVENEYEAKTQDLAKDALRQSAAKGWDILTNSARLQIQTIDAFCYMLVRRMPLTSGIGGLADVVDDPSALYLMAARRTLSHLAERDGALFRRLALYVDNNLEQLTKLIIPMLAKRDQWRIRAEAFDDELINDFCTLQHLAQEALLQVFRDEAQVDFSEVTNAALHALGQPEQPTDLLYWLDYRIQHLLVDEFQDTSRRQYKLLQALSGQWSDGDGRTLFLVGDPMQSIYRFREAEVSLFLQCWSEKRLGWVRLEPLRLVSNFRSTSEIVEWSQKTFAPIMREDDQAYGGVKLRPASAVRGPSGVVPKLIPLLNDDKGTREAEIIVELIQRAPVRRDVAILVRSRSQVTTLLPMLRGAGIDYEAIDIDCLQEEQHILDLLSLTRAVVHLGDRVAWLACLRAPWCGLTVRDLAALAEGESKRTILELLSDEDKIAALTPEGRVRAAKVQEILSAAVEQVGRLPLRDLIEKSWMALGGPAVLQGTSQSDDVDTFLALLEEREQGGVIRDFSLLDARLASLWAKPAKAADAVQILTIHNAKGLEFGTVIVPQLGKKTRASEGELVVWTEQIAEDGSFRLLVEGKPQSGVESEQYKLICDELKKKEEYELQRLFYVATTRAKNELYLLGNVKLTAKRELPSVNHTFLGLMWGDARAAFESELRTHPPAPQAGKTDEEAPPKETILRRLPASWRTPLLEMSVGRSAAYQHATASSGKPSYRWVSNTGRHVGTIVHGLLKRIAGEGAELWTEERLGEIEPMVRSELLRLGVPVADQARALLQVTQSLSNTLQSDRGRWILQPHAEARSEWGLQGLIGDHLVSGTVDRIFRDAEGQLWIIDFKTSQHEGAGLQSFLKRETDRYTPQMQNYATLVSKMQAGPIRLGLYFPLLDAWSEWAFAEEKAMAPAHYTGE